MKQKRRRSSRKAFWEEGVSGTWTRKREDMASEGNGEKFMVDTVGLE